MLLSRSVPGPWILLGLLILSLTGCREVPDTVAKLDALAQQFQTQGKLALAEQYYRQALTIREDGWGPEHLQVAPGLDHLADLYIAKGKPAEAEALLQRALAIREKRLGPEHQDVATNLEKYATLLRQLHRDAEAQPLETRTQAIRARLAQAKQVSTP